MKITHLVILSLVCFASYSYGETFTVQLASETSQASAEAQVKRFQKSELKPFTSVAQVPGKGTFYRVSVGQFPNIAQAKAYRHKLVAKKLIPAKSFVAKAESTSEKYTPDLPIFNPSPIPETVSPIPPPPPVPTPKPTPTPTPAATSSPTPEMAPIMPEEIPPIAQGPVAPEPTPTHSAQPEKKSTSPTPWAVSVYALLSSTQYNVNFPSNYGTGQNGWSSSPQLSGGAAILPTYKPHPKFEIETGLIYFQRSYNVNYNNGFTVEPGTELYTALEVPLTFHYWVFNFAALGIGAYDLFNPSGVISQNTFGGPALPDANLNGGDYGLIGGVTFKFNVNSSSDILAKIYYNYSGQNFASGGTSPQQVFTDLQFLFGLRLAL